MGRSNDVTRATVGWLVKEIGTDGFGPMGQRVDQGVQYIDHMLVSERQEWASIEIHA